MLKPSQDPHRAVAWWRASGHRGDRSRPSSSGMSTARPGPRARHRRADGESAETTQDGRRLMTWRRSLPAAAELRLSQGRETSTDYSFAVGALCCDGGHGRAGQRAGLGTSVQGNCRRCSPR